MKKVFLTLTMLLFAFVGTMRADDVEIGSLEGAATNTYLPMNSLYEYSFSEQIYTADEIGTAGTINAITLWLYGNANLYEMPFDIYMVEVDKDAFTSNTDWVSVTASNKVYSGSVTVHNTTAQAYTFTLDDPFVYSGSSNLLIAFNNNTGQWKSGLTGMVFGASTDPKRAIYARRDSTPYDIANLPAATAITYQRNVITIDITPGGGPSCPKPRNLAVAYEGGTTAEVTWVSEESNFNLKVNDNVINGVTSPYTLDGLTLATVYNVCVQTDCGTETSDWTNPVSFTTDLCMPEDQCEITLELTDSYGDGWNGNAIKVVDVTTGKVLGQFTISTGSTATHTLAVCDGRDIQFVWVAGSYPQETSYVVYDRNGIEIFSGSNAMTAPVDYTVDCAELQPEIIVTPNPVDLGARPIGAWMEPFKIQLDNVGLPVEVSMMLSDNDYFVVDSVVPFTMSHGETKEVGISTGDAAAGTVDGNLILVYTEDREFTLVPLTATSYEPVNGDVWETALEVEVPFTGTAPTGIYHNYNIPGSTDSHLDAVYKVELQEPALLNVDLGTAANAAVALYAEDFNGQNGPMVNNTYSVGGGSTPTGGQWYQYGTDQLGTSVGTGGAFYWAVMFPTGSYTGNLVTKVATYAVASYPMSGSVTIYNDLASVPTTAVGTMPMSSDGLTSEWVEFEFPAPVNIDPSKNLWIVFYDESGSAYPAGACADAGDPNARWVSIDGTEWMDLAEAGVAGYSWMIKAFVASGAKGEVTEIQVPVKPGSGTLAAAEPMAQGNRAPDTPDYSSIVDMFVNAGTYYVVAASTDAGFPVNISTNPVPAPEPSVVTVPTDGQSGVTAPFTAQWQLGNYTAEMQVLCGTQYPPTTVLIDWTSDLVTSATLTELQNNKNYFIQVNGRNSAGTTYGEVVGFTTIIDAVSGFEGAESYLYPGDAAQFSWDAVERSLMGYNLYYEANGEAPVLVNATPITETEYAVEGLEYNNETMGGYEFYVKALFAAGESEASESFMVYMTGTATISGTVYDQDSVTVIPNAAIEFRGVDEFGEDQVIACTADANGAYTCEVLVGQFTPYVVSEAYASDYAAAPAITVVYNTPQEVNLYTHEFYAPVGMVTATEEENDVLVEWAWTPAEMIVDFETGDFSQAEFTLPATYPFEVTTTNPHDGTYCMKSTCEGVASGTSSIEATVEVPYDAKVGFWVRVSSETNYDKFHFYIDGVEQGAALSGQLAYAYKEYSVGAGTHTYKWEYGKDSSVNSNDDCVYVDDITMYRQDIPVPPIPGATVYNFDDNTMMGWTSLDADNDGFGWVSSANPGSYHNAGVSLSGTGHESSEAYVISGSYANGTGQALNPNNFLIAPTQITAHDGAQINFWACAQDASYAAEHFGVAVSTTTATASAFTTINEWTLTAKYSKDPIVENSRDIRGTRVQGAWYQFTADLSAYAGQDIWVAIRHFGCTDEFILNVDDITLADGSAKPMARNDRSLQGFNLYRRDVKNGEDVAEVELLATPAADVFEYIDAQWPNLEYGMWQWGVQATYEGNAPEAGDRETTTYDFDDGTLQGWTAIDGGQPNGYGWHVGSMTLSTGSGHNGSDDLVISQSYDNNYGVVYPNNYLISPAKAQYSSISLWACGQDANYASEHFGVAVSTGGATASDFTMVQEWTIGSKGERYAGPRGNRVQSTWTEYTVDLSAYAGQDIWVAVRHFNCSDMFYLDVDDITLTTGGTTPPTPPTPPTPAGNGLSEIVWSNIIEKDMYADVTVNVSLNNNQAPTGAVVTFEGVETYTATVDATGTVVFDNFRKGDYTFNVELDGYYLAADFEHNVTVDDNEVVYDVVLYEYILPVENLYVSPTGWAMWDGNTAGGTPTPGPGPGPGPVGGSSFTEGFEGGLNGWNVLTVNADGGEWIHSDDNLGGYDYTTHAHGGTGFAMCYSFVDYVGSFNTDSYLYTPQKYDIVAGSTLNFFADNANDSYPESFSVCVATADNPTASDFTQVWSGSAKMRGMNSSNMRHINNRYDNWRAHSIDLSAYAGQSVYIAFHDVNYDMYEVWIDDVELTTSAKGDRAPLSFKVKLDGVFEGETENPYFQHNVEGFEAGSEHTTEVAALYATGLGDWVAYNWIYMPCDEYTGVTDYTAAAQDNTVTLTWTLNGSTPPTPPTPPTPGPGTTYDFDDGTLQGWTAIDGGQPNGYGWQLGSLKLGTGYGHNGSADMVLSQSYDNNYGVIYPNNYLISPAKAQYTSISLWACGQDANYASEHFGIAVSTGGATASEFTMVQEWTIGSKGDRYAGPRGNRDQSTWTQYTVDLSAYAGQDIWVAVRHFNCSDMFYLDVDDITLNGVSKGNRTVVYEPHFVTDPGAMANGADASWTKNGNSTWGPNINNNSGYMLADDFTLTSATTITEIEAYGYQTGSTTTSTFTGLYATIYDGAPNAGGSIVWGDMADNIMTATSFTNCYRGSDGEVNATTRPIMAVTATGLNIELPAGTYYLVWSLAGTASSGPWAAPEALPNVGNTGDGIQYTTSGWAPLMDSGSGTPYGGAFKLVGEGGTPGPNPPTPPTPGELLGVYVFRDGELISGQTPLTTNSFVDGNVEAGEHEYCVRVVYSDYAMSCPECETVEIEGGSGCDPVTNLTGEYTVDPTNGPGVLLQWEGNANAYAVYYGSTLLGQTPDQSIFIYGFPGDGDYTFGVVAIYDDCESDMETVTVYYDDIAENSVVNNLYPNPTNGKVTIEAQGMNHITVATALGQVVYDADVDADQIELNLGQYNAGLYLVRVSTVNGVSVKRVTVVK